MTHEHHGECCNPNHASHHSENLDTRQAQSIQAIGNLCCQGACSHPEHIATPGHLIDQVLRDDDEWEYDGNGVRKKKKKWLASDTPYGILDMKPERV